MREERCCCAARPFSDSLAAGATLLTDEAATLSSIESALEQLTHSTEDDLIVISFSGHGSKTHQLVTYDSDPNNLDNTSLSLERLGEFFTRIPARHLICILDCCFSGGVEAKVLDVSAIPRDLRSEDSLLAQLSGRGRLILTAASAVQPAWESPKLGHGILTWYMLEALQGAAEVVQAGKISVYRLLEHVTQRVIAEARRLGKVQHPTLRGKVDGNLTWPIFRAGANFLAAFPEHGRAPVTEAIASLSSYGFPAALLDAWAAHIPTLNALQLAAVNEYGVLDGNHLLVSAPTSSGKTMVGELAALQGALRRKRSFFLLPLKALVNDKHQAFLRTYGAFGIRTIRATGDTTDDIPELMRGRFDICLMTYEKFAALVLGAPYLLEQVGTIVVDEVQMIADASRGVNLEFILTLLRMRREEGIEPQLIALSAVIGDTNGFERWLGARLLRREERPVPLDEGILCADGTFRYVDPDGKEQRKPGYIRPRFGKGSSQDLVIPLVSKLLDQGDQIIVFRETRGEARGCAGYLARESNLRPARETLDALPTSDLSGASKALRDTLASGIAFHVSDLERDERLAIEEGFRAQNSSLRVICATTTLAMGINTPAEAVVIAGLEHPGESGEPYSIAEYKNMVGRAGRLGLAERGTSFLIALSASDEHSLWSRYVRGKPEDLKSRFATEGADPRSLIIRVLAAIQKTSTQGLKADDILSFLHSSFGAFQQMQVSPTWKWNEESFRRALNELEAHRLIAGDPLQGYVLTPLGRLGGEAGVAVESLIRVIDLLRSMPAAAINDPTLLAVTQVTLELSEVLFPLNKKSTQKEPHAWPFELQRQGVAPSVINSLGRWAEDSHAGTLRAKKAVACLLWITGTPIATIEGTLTQYGGAFGGAAGPIRSVATRTADLLGTVARIADLLHGGTSFTQRASRLITRLQLGVPGASVELAAALGNLIGRGDYQNMQESGLASLEAVESATDADLEKLLGGTPEAKRKVAGIRERLESRKHSSQLPTAALEILPLYQP